jgi:hypothetical protein
MTTEHASGPVTMADGPGSPDSPPSRPWGRRLARRVGRTVVTLLVIGGVAVGGGGYFAKRAVCDAVATDLAAGSASVPDDGGTPIPTGGLEGAAGRLHNYGQILFFDSDLRSAAKALADDLDQLITLEHKIDVNNPSAAGYGRIVVIAGSVNTHARDAQRACGLPVTGIFGG